MYYSIQITGSQYRILESQTKLENANTTLDKINEVVSKKLTYQDSSDTDSTAKLYQIATTIKDKKHDKRLELVSTHVPKCLKGIFHYFFPFHTDRSEINADREAKNRDRAEKIRAKALESPAIKALYEQVCALPTQTSKYGSATESGSWSIEFVDDLTCTANCEYWNRKINIRSDRSDDEALTGFVFELTNALNSGRHYDLHLKVTTDQIQCDDFVRETERIEYEGALLHHEVMNKAVEEMDWNPALDKFKNLPKDFDVHYARLKIRSPSRAHDYRKAWVRVRKGAGLSDSGVDIDGLHRKAKLDRILFSAFFV